MIDVDKIPKTVQESLARITLRKVREYFENPEHQKEFEIWLKNKKKI